MPSPFAAAGQRGRTLEIGRRGNGRCAAAECGRNGGQASISLNRPPPAGHRHHPARSTTRGGALKTRALARPRCPPARITRSGGGLRLRRWAGSHRGWRHERSRDVSARNLQSLEARRALRVSRHGGEAGASFSRASHRSAHPSEPRAQRTSGLRSAWLGCEKRAECLRGRIGCGQGWVD